MKLMAPLLAMAAAASVTLAVGGLALAQPPAAPAPAPPAVEPLIKDAHWHHVHLNSTDPAAAIDFYTTHFDAKKARFAGLQDAVWTQKSWMLFTRVNAPPSKKRNTAIWHIGWGAEDPHAEYARQQKLGAKFFVPLTDIAANNGGTLGRFFFMYVESPEGGLIELNTASHHRFGHVHLFSADPLSAGDWWIKTFGARGSLTTPQQRQAPPRFSVQGNQLSPSKNLNIDNVNLIIYPVGYSKNAYKEDWEGITELQPSRGGVHDHVGISVPNLTEALAKLKDAGIKVTAEPRTVGPLKFAFIEGPDKIAIEIIEDTTDHPPYE